MKALSYKTARNLIVRVYFFKGERNLRLGEELKEGSSVASPKKSLEGGLKKYLC